MTVDRIAIDHVTVAGRDLKAMCARLASVGIPTEYGGSHDNNITEMAIASFPDGSYLELIAMLPDAGPAAVATHVWSPYIQGDAGPCAWAVRVPDLEAERTRLTKAQIAISEPASGGRRRPDGVRLEWKTANVGTEPSGTFFPFLIRDVTPREQRVFPGGRPLNESFAGVSRVVIAVRDLEVSIARFRKAYGLAPPQQDADEGFEARIAIFTRTPVVLVSPLNEGSWLTSRVQEFGEGPCALLLRGGNRGRFQVHSESAWLGTRISWLDASKLGWRLGFEAF